MPSLEYHLSDRLSEPATKVEDSAVVSPVSPRQASEIREVFQEQEDADIRYRTLSWQYVSLLMIAEIVSNGMLSLPSAVAVVGIVPSVILILFLGIFGLFTAKLLIDFKLNHPNVHSMGDAGDILGGPVIREVLATGTIIFAICGTGSELLSGQQALAVMSNNGLCNIQLLVIFSIATLLVALPRTLDRLSKLSLLSVSLITIAGIIAMSTNFYQAFLSITNPVFSYAGHFMFFIIISEMCCPEDAMKAAWCLQGFATVFYTCFAVTFYVYLGENVMSPAFLSLPSKWAKATFGIAILNFLIAGGLYSHTAAKLVFVRLFRQTRHVYKHTVLGWSAWFFLCLIAVTVAFILAAAVPIFSYLIGISAALFASWYTYGLAGCFWLHDVYHLEGGAKGLVWRPIGVVLAVATVLAGAFICVSGTYVSIKLIVDAYQQGLIGKPFTC